MKKLIAILFAVLFTASVFGQAPQKISYQAVIRDAGSVLITSTVVGMQISILQGSPTGTLVYVETQTPTTNVNGLVSVEIGGGIGFDTINWANGQYFIKTETDPLGGTTYTISGTSQLLSVPYALHAKTAENITGGIIENDPVYGSSVASGITGTDITNWNNKLDVEVDGSVTNELQALSISNDTVYLTNGGFVKLPAGFNGQYSSLTGAPTNVSSFTNDAGYLTSEVDGSITNELQALSISNDTVYLTNGGFVKLPAGFNGQYSSLTGAPTNVSSFTNDAGYLTSFTEIDGSVTNELQALSLSNDTVFLTNGGFVKLPPTNAWSLTGNTGTVDGTNFIGTTDNVPFNFRVNNQKAGRIDPAGSTFFGYQAGNVNADPTNTGFGYQALYLNTSGIRNTAIGYWALNANTTGSYNTADGIYALQYNTTGSENTASGHAALYLNTTGYQNTASGQAAMYGNTIGNNNTAYGVQALNINTTGNFNTGCGSWAGHNNSTGSGNVFLGYQAGYNETGSNKLYIANSSTNPPLIYGDFSTAKVGIGTTTPGAKLDVQNSTNGINSISSVNTSGTNAYAGYFQINNSNNNFNAVFATTNGAGAAINASNTYTGGNALRDGIRVTVTGTGGTTNTAGYFSASGSTNNYACVFDQGNVGIGTTTPASQLNVRSSSYNLLKLETTGANTNVNIDIATTGAGKAQFTQTGGTGGFAFYPAGVIGVPTLAIVPFGTTGNVGIGTTTPGAKLEVNGNLLFTGTSTVSPTAGLFNLTVRAGDGPASGGTMTIRGGQAGSATGGAGGNLELQGGGNMPSGGAGYGNLGVAGAVNIIGGSGYNSTGGNVSIAAGATSCWALGGAVHSDVTIRGGMNYAVADAASIVAEGGYVNGGCSGNSTGGNLILKAGVGQGAGQPGKIQMVGLPVYANNAAAIAGGLTVGSLYRTGADPDPVCIVH